MAETTGIAWTRSTFNPWIGCTKVGPGCDGCYAEQLDAQRLSKTLGGGTKDNPIIHWGYNAPRYRTKKANWNKVYKWNAQAEWERRNKQLVPDADWHEPGHWPVFCASLADVFDNEVEQQWRDDLWGVIGHCSSLSWLLVTKRIGNVAKMVPALWMKQGFPAHVRVLITVVNQEEANRDIAKLLELPCHNGVSYEPALGPINWTGICSPGRAFNAMLDISFGRHLEWIIVGGESSQGEHKARPFNLDWARDVRDQCRYANVPCFIKQLGSAPYWRAEPLHILDRAGADPAEWPEDLRVQEFPA